MYSPRLLVEDTDYERIDHPVYKYRLLKSPLLQTSITGGNINEHYLEKLSRLDYELIARYTDQSDSPLADLLSHIKGEIEPDYLLIDCRAGLHDLGGLAVHQLSHANVIFGLDSEQSWQGLRCILRGLGLIDPPPPCLLVPARMTSV